MKRIKHYETYKLSQVYKTGEKGIDHISRRGKKPIGWNAYKRYGKSLLFHCFFINMSNSYMPLVIIDGKICGESFI